MARKRSQPPKSEPVTFETVRQIALALPGVEEGTSYGTEAFKVGKKLFIRLHQSEPAIVVGMDESERAMRMKSEPETFYITDHYRDYPWVLVRLSSISRDDLRDLLEASWRRCTPERVVTPREKN